MGSFRLCSKSLKSHFSPILMFSLNFRRIVLNVFECLNALG